MKVIKNRKEFDSLLLENNIVVVDFFATWCGPCVRLTPELEILSEKYCDNIIIIKVDVDNNKLESLSEECNISCMPTIVFYKNQNIIEDFRVEGGDIEKIESNIKKLIEDQKVSIFENKENTVEKDIISENQEENLN
jgi:thioredoxin 1